jgi:hypothetical protein
VLRANTGHQRYGLPWLRRLADGGRPVAIELPEALAEIDPEEQAGELEDAPARPMELEHVRLQ